MHESENVSRREPTKCSMLKPLYLSAQKSKLFIVTMNDETLHQRLCSVQGCMARYSAKGLCKTHYNKVIHAAYYTNPVNYWIRYFHNKYYYRMPGVYEKHLARSRAPKNKKYRVEYRRIDIHKPRTLCRDAAGRAVNRALRKGQIKKKPCEVCSSTKRIHGHHDSYMPESLLFVRWLCSKHHGEWHRSNEPVYPSSV